MKDIANIHRAAAFSPVPEIQGQWKFEAVYDDGRVEPLLDFHNDQTELWAEYNAIISNYYSVVDTAHPCGHLIPGAIGIYEDSTPLNLSADAAIEGELRGFIDFTSANPVTDDDFEGFRLTKGTTSEVLGVGVTKYTYQGEFPTSTGQGLSNRIKLLGISSHSVWDNARRTISDNSHGVKKCTMLGGAGNVPVNPILRVGVTAVQADRRLTYPPLFAGWVDDGSSSWYNRKRVALQAIAIDRWACLAESPYGGAETITIQPILKVKYDNVYRPQEALIKAEPLATIILADKGDDSTYSASSAFFRDNDYVVVTHDDFNITIDYYSEGNGYTRSTTVIPAPKPPEFEDRPWSLVAGYKDQVMTIMQGCRVNTTDLKDLQTQYVTDVLLDDWSVISAQKPIDLRNVLGLYSFETHTSYADNVLSYIYYSPNTKGYYIHAANAGYSLTSNEIGWIWLKDDPLPLTHEEGMVHLGDSLLGNWTPYYVSAGSWFERTKFAANNKDLRTMRLRVPPAITSQTELLIDPGMVLVNPNQGLSFAYHRDSGWGCFTPLTLFKNPVLTEAITAEITKTEAFGLRVTYELTVTE